MQRRPALRQGCNPSPPTQVPETPPPGRPHHSAGAGPRIDEGRKHGIDYIYVDVDVHVRMCLCCRVGLLDVGYALCVVCCWLLVACWIMDMVVVLHCWLLLHASMMLGYV